MMAPARQTIVISPGKAFSAIFETKRNDFRRCEFRVARTRCAPAIIVAFPGLVVLTLNSDFRAARRSMASTTVRIDGQSALAAAGDQNAKRLFRFCEAQLRRNSARTGLPVRTAFLPNFSAVMG